MTSGILTVDLTDPLLSQTDWTSQSLIVYLNVHSTRNFERDNYFIELRTAIEITVTYCDPDWTNADLTDYEIEYIIGEFDNNRSGRWNIPSHASNTGCTRTNWEITLDNNPDSSYTGNTLIMDWTWLDSDKMWDDFKDHEFTL